MKQLCAFFAALAAAGTACTSRSYTYFLIDTPVEKTDAVKEDATRLRPETFGPVSVMKVRWNDGQVFTEVDVPLLSSGQRILVSHNDKKAGAQGGTEPKGDVAKRPSRGAVPPAPTKADGSLSDAYRERGLKENPSAPDVSISRTKAQLQDALKAGNYALALEYAELVLARYPSHPEFLRAKGSILLLMGEKEKAIEVYEAAEEIESDPKVKKQLQELRKQK